MIDIRTGEEMSRRDFGKGIAAILAAGCAPSVMGGMMRNVGARNAAMFGEKLEKYWELVGSDLYAVNYTVNHDLTINVKLIEEQGNYYAEVS